jgi:lysozyme
VSGAARAGLMLTGMFAALSLASVGLIEDEGWVTVTYDDPAHGAALPTACAGVTGKGVVAGKRYSQAECEAMTAKAMLEHALAIQGCLPVLELPTQTHAAFIRFTYNVGGPRACASTMFQKARAGDLKGACEQIPKWVYAAGRQFPGLVKRRTRERAMCDAGLS